MTTTAAQTADFSASAVALRTSALPVSRWCNRSWTRAHIHFTSCFLRRSAIDQHINTRNRWDDIIPVIQKYPTLLGIGLSEGTAIVVTGDHFRVIGKWKAAIHDNTRLYQPWEKPYYVLSAGDEYDMKARWITKYGNGTLVPEKIKPSAANASSELHE